MMVRVVASSIAGKNCHGDGGVIEQSHPYDGKSILAARKAPKTSSRSDCRTFRDWPEDTLRIALALAHGGGNECYSDSSCRGSVHCSGQKGPSRRAQCY